MQKMGKRGAIELSISTIVIIVLAMSMLILGLVLVKNIFSSGNQVLDMSSNQIKDQVSKMFGEDKKLVLYPDTRLITIAQGKTSGFGIGIQNLISGTSGSDKKSFSYKVEVADADVQKKCGVSSDTMLNLIQTGREESNIDISSGGTYTTSVMFKTSTGDPLCLVRFRVTTYVNGQTYETSQMDVNFVAK